jgi:hypothetical protein
MHPRKEVRMLGTSSRCVVGCTVEEQRQGLNARNSQERGEAPECCGVEYQ